LKDGADSSAWPALITGLRHIAMCSEYWLSLNDAVEGIGIRPFVIDKARKDCADYRPLKTHAGSGSVSEDIKPMYLKDAHGGDQYINKKSGSVKRGKVYFAEQCASSLQKRPPKECE